MTSERKPCNEWCRGEDHDHYCPNLTQRCCRPCSICAMTPAEPQGPWCSMEGGKHHPACADANPPPPKCECIVFFKPGEHFDDCPKRPAEPPSVCGCPPNVHLAACKWRETMEAVEPHGEPPIPITDEEIELVRPGASKGQARMIARIDALAAEVERLRGENEQLRAESRRAIPAAYRVDRHDR